MTTKALTEADKERKAAKAWSEGEVRMMELSRE